MTHGLTDGSEAVCDDDVAAAVVALIASRAVVTPAPADEPPSRWRDHTAPLRAALMPGPGSWRTSALPR